jgi:hypothetical protein
MGAQKKNAALENKARRENRDRNFIDRIISKIKTG